MRRLGLFKVGMKYIVFDEIRDKDNALQGMRMGWDFLLRETRSARISM